jgi:hypothetical protein
VLLGLYIFTSIITYGHLVYIFVTVARGMAEMNAENILSDQGFPEANFGNALLTGYVSNTAIHHCYSVD